MSKKQPTPDLVAQLAAAKDECERLRRELNEANADWRNVMADVHDYFADERAERESGRVCLLMSLLGNLRCERDLYRDQLAALRTAHEADRAAMREAMRLLEKLQWQDDLDETACPTGGVYCSECDGGGGSHRVGCKTVKLPPKHLDGCAIKAALSALAARLST